MHWRAKTYISILIASALLALAVADHQSEDPALFAVCAILTALASCWKIQVPNVPGNVSAGFVFLLIAAGQFGSGETAAIALVSGLTQSLFRKKTPPRLFQVAFNTSALVVAAMLMNLAGNALIPGRGPAEMLARLVFGGTALFAFNSIAVAALFWLMGHATFREACRQIRIWVAPYYAAGGVIAAAVVETSAVTSEWAGLALMPLMTLAYQYYRDSVAARALNSSGSIPRCAAPHPRY